MSRTSLSFAFGVLFLVSTAAYGDNMYFPSISGGTTWGSNPTVYVNPYSAYDTTKDPTKKNPLTIFCDDWNTDFTPPATWQATINSLSAATTSLTVLDSLKYGKGNTDNGGTTYYTNSVSFNGSTVTITQTQVATQATQTLLYREAAYLASEYNQALVTAAVNHTTVSADVQDAYSAAIWTLFVNDTAATSLKSDINNSNSAFKTDFAADLASLTSMPGSFTGAGWYLITPNAGYTMQEFLVYDASGDIGGVPEPTSVILLGSILAFVSLKIRSRRQQA